jgi:mono/diheme cytochrome c family protein
MTSVSFLLSLYLQLWAADLSSASPDAEGLRPGLQVIFQSTGPAPGAIAPTDRRPNLALAVPAGQAPTAFLAPGPFRAVWTGFISSELRGQYSFQADLSGALQLDINGKRLLDTEGTGGLTRESPPIRLNKGTNLLQAVFTSPAQGDALLRLHWIPKGAPAAPIPAAALSSGPRSSETTSAEQLRLGRALFIEDRCVRCHATTAGSADPATNLEGPSLEGIGSRRNRAWLAEWILNPKAQRPTARMPRLFHGPTASEDARAAAAFLASLHQEAGDSAALAPPSPQGESGKAADTDQVAAGQRLFNDLHCAACHNSPDAQEPDSTRISLANLLRKFPRAALASFLRKPEAHNAWTRMPNFKLTVEEAAHLMSYLVAPAEPLAQSPSEPVPTAEQVQRGRELVQSRGCLNCHALRLANEFTAPTLAALSARAWQTGCLRLVETNDSKTPFYALSNSEREALAAAAKSTPAALTCETPAEFAQRQIPNLRCAECHGKFDGFPSLEMIAGKLRPEWMEQFLAGQIASRPRPWLSARMPAFPQYARGLAQGFAMLHGVPPVTPAEPAIDLAAAKVGQKLVSAEGGFSCIACHAVAKVGATQVFENAGINLAYGANRLLKPYFQRWVRNPLAIDPVSKMPVFFDENFRSPLADIYDGNGAGQVDAIWQYMRLGDQMPPPNGTQSGP